MKISLSSACVALGMLYAAFSYAAAPQGIEVLRSAGQPFNVVAGAPVKFEEGRLTQESRSGGPQSVLMAHIAKPLRKNDVLWVSFKARKISSKRETGEAAFNLRIERLVDGKAVWPPDLERGISVGAEWTETSIPFVLERDATPDDMRVAIDMDAYQQSFEIAGFTLRDYGPGVALSSLPRTTVRYPGGEADAPWRQEALARIEKLRKGDLAITVRTADGKPAAGAKVEVHMLRSAFNWGTAVTSKNLLADTPDGARYREVVAKYFNQVVFENEAKAKYWFREPAAQRGVGIARAHDWLQQHHITARGHVMVWPSWQHSAHLTQFKDDPQALRSAIMDGIAGQTAALRGQFTEWDVVNEPYAHHDILDILGKRELVDWFAAARKGAPGVRLFLNDYTMFHGSGSGTGSASQSFYDTVAWLKQNGAQIDAIGEQGHIGGTPPGIPFVLERLDHFGQLGLPIQISEFDINSNDDDFKARYLRDFMTAVYSHPSVAGFVQWGFWEGMHWFPVAALWNKDWTLRQHGQVFTELVGKTWRTDFNGVTNNAGISSLRAYTGEYEVTVSYQGKTVKQVYTLTNQGGLMNLAIP